MADNRDYTTNLELVLPKQSDQYNVNDFNDNMTKIDQFAGQVPARALTADTLTVARKINGVNFKGDTDIVTGAGFYYNTVTYSEGDLAFIYNSIGDLELHKSLVAGNIGHNPLTSTGYWEKVELGGSGGRNVGEIIQSSLPLTDAGLHLLDGTRLSGDGIYKGFVDYIADLYNDTKVYNPSAFTIVGSPTITADGIASGFSSSNYLTGSFTSVTPSKIIFRTKGVYSSTPNAANGSQVIGKIQGTNSSPSLEYNPNAKRLAAIKFHNNSSTDNFSANIIVPLNDGDIVEAEVIATSTFVTLNAKINGVPYTNTWSGNGLYCGAINGCLIPNDSNWYWTGSIDLKQFSITVDGVEVFSGSNPANYFTTEALWQQSVTTYGVCGKFVYDSTNNTVRLPKITGIIEGTTDVNALGDLVEAGLPNITGTMTSSGWKLGGPALTGAFYKKDTGGERPSYGSSGGSDWYFDASRSNPIYGNSTTVQPQTIKAFYYIVIANSTKTEIQSDINEIATDLNGKADTDLTNVPASKGILQESYINGTSWYRVYSDGWCEQGGYYVPTSSAYNYTISLLKPYTNTDYCIYLTGQGIDDRNYYQDAYSVFYQNKTVNSFKATHDISSTEPCYWRTCGYIN